MTTATATACQCGGVSGEHDERCIATKTDPIVYVWHGDAIHYLTPDGCNWKCPPTDAAEAAS